jgi:hypothetical protein
VPKRDNRQVEGQLFELGRELKRLFSHRPAHEGLSLGDPSLLELLDVTLLQAEGRSADVAAGRVGAKDRVTLLVEASVVWRELARRTGDAAALRKAASCAEEAAELARSESRPAALSEALCQQAHCALLGSELFGEEGLASAADYLLERAPQSLSTQALRARLLARRAMAGGDAPALRAAGSAYDRVLGAPRSRARAQEAYAAALLGRERGEFLVAGGARLKDVDLVRAGLMGLDAAAALLNGDYHPIALARVEEARGVALVRLAELTGDVGPAFEAADLLEAAADLITADHAPLDWARLHHARGLALMTVAEASGSESPFDKALQAFGKAHAVLDGAANLALRTVVAQDRADCLVRRAEVRGDGFALDEAEAVLRSELAGLRAPPDPVAWAVLQLNLARVYVAQAAANGQDRGERARAGEALLGAFEVFAEHGLRTLAAAAEDGLERLREDAAAHR